MPHSIREYIENSLLTPWSEKKRREQLAIFDHMLVKLFQFSPTNLDLSHSPYSH